MPREPPSAFRMQFGKTSAEPPAKDPHFASPHVHDLTTVTDLTRAFCRSAGSFGTTLRIGSAQGTPAFPVGTWQKVNWRRPVSQHRFAAAQSLQNSVGFLILIP